MNCFTVMLKKCIAPNSNLAFAFLHSTSASNVLKREYLLKLARTFSDSDIVDYSKLTLDSNPLHFDSEIAKLAGFTDRLVPGMLVASLFPRIIASHFPGAVYVSQTLQFKLPVYIGEEITAEIQATAIRETKNKYMAKFSTKCFKDEHTLVIDGEAAAILPTLTVKEQ